jgi:hypothetical protein
VGEGLVRSGDGCEFHDHTDTTLERPQGGHTCPYRRGGGLEWWVAERDGVGQSMPRTDKKKEKQMKVLFDDDEVWARKVAEDKDTALFKARSVLLYSFALVFQKESKSLDGKLNVTLGICPLVGLHP